MSIRLAPPVCRDLESAITREWLVTNGLGGFASGTIAGPNARRYHGLLVASLQPPVRRVVLLAALEEWLIGPDGQRMALSSQEYWDGTVFPDGYRHLEQVRLDGMLPVFRWTISDRTIEKRLWMEAGHNRTIISYRLLRGAPARLRLQPLFAHRDFHAHRHGHAFFDTVETADGWTVEADGLTCHLQARPHVDVLSRPDWYWRFLHRVERERGLDDEEDLFTPGALELSLDGRARVTLAAGVEALPPHWSADRSLRSVRTRQRDLLKAAGATEIGAPRPLRQLVLAAEQFRVARVSPDPGPSQDEQRTIIAGYHWFADWGRDAMISLPGLSLLTGRASEARQILTTFVAHLDQGMVPNFFHEAGQATAYNAIDGSLWLFESLHAYLAATSEWSFVLERLPLLEEVIQRHTVGTRYQIRMDPQDGLLRGGDEGVALTWMDAKVQDWVVTPRRGKPVEVNALWYNALRLLADWRERAHLPFEPYREMAQRTRRAAVSRFWYAAGGYLHDVVDGPDGDDSSLRPNQLLALSLTYPLFEGPQARSALEAVTAHLLTPYGLRSLSPQDPRYQGHYRGDLRARDAAYHMGTVWPWLLGPYLDAHYRTYRDRRAVRRLLRPFEAHLTEAGLGTISEIFEGDAPHRPVGCIAQAWSVAEILRHVRLGGRRRRPRRRRSRVGD